MLTKIQNFYKFNFWGLTFEEWYLFINSQKFYIIFDETFLSSKAKYHINIVSD